MKSGSNRKSRSRSNNKQRGGGGGRNSYDSSGPAGKVRGTAQQVWEKYQALGHDASSAGDRIAAESYFQFAEHYYRIANANGEMERREQQRLSEERVQEENSGVAANASVDDSPGSDLNSNSRPPEQHVSERPAVAEVLTVPIMPGPIDTPNNEEAKTANTETPASRETADADVVESAPKPVRRRRARPKAARAEKVDPEAPEAAEA